VRSVIMFDSDGVIASLTGDPVIRRRRVAPTGQRANYGCPLEAGHAKRCVSRLRITATMR